jgi:hypothetical protein
MPRKAKARPRPGLTVVSIELDSDLVETVDAALSARGTDIATYIRLQLRAFKAAKALLNLDSQMTFGKYTGEPVEAICRADPTYMEWLIANGTTAKFDVDVLRLLKSLDDTAKQKTGAALRVVSVEHR